jgi:hypothetical protein
MISRFTSKVVFVLTVLVSECWALAEKFHIIAVSINCLFNGK